MARSFNRRLALCGTAAVALAVAQPAFAQPRSFNIPAEDARQGIPEFARQAGVQISAPAESGIRTNAVNGTLDVEAALHRLIAGTGLEIASSTSGMIILRQVANPLGNVPTGANSEPSTGEEAAQNDSARQQAIVVTGTHIAGVSPSSPLITLSRTDIERSGVTSTRDLLRQLPQNYGGGVSAFNNQGVPQSNNLANPGQATGINLRGLGADATLVLLNGYRLAPSGTAGAVDISSIPLSAIARVDVLTDGASAIYGADAMGGVVNFVLKPGYNGAESRFQYGGSTDGGARDTLAGQSFGRAWSSGSALLSYEYESQSAIYASQRDYASALTLPTTLLPSTKRHSVLATVSQDLGPDLNLYAQGFFTQRKALSRTGFNGFYTLNNSSKEQQYGGSVALKANLIGDWAATFSATYVRDHIDFVGQQIFITTGPGTPTSNFDTDAELNLEAKTSGTIVNLAGGAVKAAVGGGYRALYPSFASKTGTSTSRVATKDQRDAYAFGEIHIPFVSEANQTDLVRALSVDFEGRYESYSDFGNAFSPKIGLVYKPIEELRLRGTWGKSFHAPNPFQLYQSLQTLFFNVPAGAAPRAPFRAFYEFGGNSDLLPEKSTSWTAGFDFVSQHLPGLTVSGTYFDTRYRNRILPFAGSIFAVFNQAGLANTIIPNPPLATLQALLAAPGIHQDATGGAPLSSAAYLVDARTFNAAATITRGVDLLAAYKTDMGFGHLDLSLNATKLFKYDVQNTPGAAFQSELDRIFFVPSFRMRGGASLSIANWNLTTFVNHTSGETNTTVTPPQPMKSWTTVDAQLSYTVPRHSGPFSNTAIKLNVQNLLDTPPPFAKLVGFPVGFDGVNATALGRFVSAAIVKDW